MLVQVYNPTHHSIVLKSSDGDSIQIQSNSKPIIDEKFLFQWKDSPIKILDKQPYGFKLPVETVEEIVQEPVAVKEVQQVKVEEQKQFTQPTNTLKQPEKSFNQNNFKKKY